MTLTLTPTLTPTPSLQAVSTAARGPRSLGLSRPLSLLLLVNSWLTYLQVLLSEDVSCCGRRHSDKGKQQNTAGDVFKAFLHSWTLHAGSHDSPPSPPAPVRLSGRSDLQNTTPTCKESAETRKHTRELPLHSHRHREQLLLDLSTQRAPRGSRKRHAEWLLVVLVHVTSRGRQAPIEGGLRRSEPQRALCGSGDDW